MSYVFDNGVTPKKFAGFVTPSVIMLVFIALYYLIDSIFVSNFVGENALAAINIVYPVAGIGWGLAVMMAAGSSAIVAIRMGEGKQREANEKFTLICIVAAVLGVICIALGLFYLDSIISFLGATDVLWDYCKDYGWIIILAAPVAFVGVLMEYFIRVDGRPGFTLFLYVVGGVVHILLDVLFIVYWGWGIAGAGWATAIGQAAVAVLGFGYFLTQKTILKFCRPKFDFGYLVHSFVNGSSEMVSESSVAITTFLYNMVVLRLVGEAGVAALSIVQNAHYLLISTHLGFITGVAPIISYYFGAKEYSKVNIFLRYSKNFILVSSIVLAALALLGAEAIANVFVEEDGEVYNYAVIGVRFISIAFLFTGVNVFASGFFTAYANGKISALISLSRGLIMVIVGLAFLPRLFGIEGVWMVIGFAEIATLGLSIFMFWKYRDVYHYSLKAPVKMTEE